MVPHLITALTGPINELEQRIIDSMPATERWFRLEWMEHTPPFYTSVDIRNAGFKLAPVDTNLFPAGWNHLTPEMLPLAVQAAMAAIEKICPEARNLLIIPENHTRHSGYLSSLAQLRRIFNMAGLNVRIGSISPDVNQPLVLDLPHGESITLEPVLRDRGRIGLKNFDPCTILLNNDLSAGVPGILKTCTANICCPPCTLAGVRGAKVNTFAATKKSPNALASCSESIIGLSIRCLVNAVMSTLPPALAWSLYKPKLIPCWAKSGASTKSTASTKSLLSWSRPTTAATA